VSSLILSGLLVFALRVVDMALDTLRLLFVMRGKKALAGVIGSLQAAVYILAIGAALSGPLNFWTVTGYALGFGTGVVVGMLAEEWLAVGYARLQIYTRNCGSEIAKALHEAGHAATLSWAEGMQGPLNVIDCAVMRKNLPAVYAIIEGVDKSAFITLDDVQPVHGHFSPRPGTISFVRRRVPICQDEAVTKPS